jgi:branched-chain amino acid transport system substrate-binding protein
VSRFPVATLALRVPFPRVLLTACSLTLLLATAGCGTDENQQNAPAPAVEQAPLTPQAPPAPPLPPPLPKPPVTASAPYLNGKVDIALLLPLTGPNAALGNDMLAAAQLALLDQGGPNLALTPKDTGGTPDGAAKAATAAVAEGAKLIIGPLTAPEVSAAKPIAQQAGISIIAFSNNDEIAGDNVFLLGFLPRQEITRVIDYARSTGLDHLAVLAPSSPYGQIATDTAQQVAGKDGFDLDDTEVFQADESDLSAVVQHLDQNGQFTFNALLVPAGGPQLKNVALQLAGAQIGPPKVRLLGTGLWATPDLAAQPGLIGGWYAAPSPEAGAVFQQHFQETYGHAPQLLAALAYDATALAAVLDRSRGDDFSAQSLTNPSGFAGVDGIFRLMPDGTNQRGLAVLEVDQGGPKVVSPAPVSFAAAPQVTQ